MSQIGNDVAARWRSIIILCLLGSGLHAARVDAAPPPAPATSARAAIEPAAPVVPAEVVAALQGGEYEAAQGAHRSQRQRQGSRR